MTTKTATAAPGVIRADEAYTLPEFRARMNLGAYSMRELRAAGFNVRRFGKRAFILGSDFLEFVAGLQGGDG